MQVVEPGVWIEDGEQTRLGPLDAGVMVRVTVRLMAPALAEMMALPAALDLAVALKPAEDAPVWTTTAVGTLT